MKALFVYGESLGFDANVKAVYDMLDCEKDTAPQRPTPGAYDYRNAEKDGYDVVVTDDYLYPIEGKKHVKIIDVGHGVDGFKLCGANWFDADYSEYPRGRLLQTDYLIAASPWTAGVRSSECLDQVKSIPLGLPKYDRYAEYRHHEPGEKRVYLYVPSWRAESDGKFPDIDWGVLDASLTDNEVLIVKRHRISGNEIAQGEYRHIIEVDNSQSSMPYIERADAIITDYSSIMADAWMLGVPVVLFCPDVDTFLDNRGMYRKYPSEYSPHSTKTQDGLIELVREAVEDGQRDFIGSRRELFMSACTPGATERVVQFIKDVAGDE